MINIVRVFTSVCGTISGKAVCRMFGRIGETAWRLMSLRHIRVLKSAALFLIGSSALTSVALFPAPLDTNPQSPVPVDFSFAGYEAGRPVPSVKGVLAVKPSGGDDK